MFNFTKFYIRELFHIIVVSFNAAFNATFI